MWSSEGSPVREVPATAGPDYNSFTLTYHNRIGFRSDLTVAVDNIFARIEAGDQDAQKLASDFIQPGFDVLAGDYGISLSATPPTANPRLRQLQFQTDWSPWVTSDTMPLSPLSRLSRDSANVGSCRWQARLLKAYAEFNSLTPKRITIHAELVVKMQILDKSTQKWAYLYLDQRAKAQLSRSVRTALLKRYYTYLANNYDVDVSSPAFRGFHEKQN